MRRVLVHPGRESDRIGEGETHRADRRGADAWSSELRESRRDRGIEAREREIVRGFRVEGEQQRAEERIEHADRARGRLPA